MKFYTRFDDRESKSLVTTLQGHFFVKYGEIEVDTLEDLMELSDIYKKQVALMREDLESVDGKQYLNNVWTLSFGYFE